MTKISELYNNFISLLNREKPNPSAILTGLAFGCGLCTLLFAFIMISYIGLDEIEMIIIFGFLSLLSLIAAFGFFIIKLLMKLIDKNQRRVE